jgi:hypothetical protein
MIADTLPAVIGLVQMGVLELHTWGATRDALDRPLLSNIMMDDLPNPSMFMEVLGNPIQQAGQRGPVRVFGDMVSLLWAEGKHQAAIRLEELWNTHETLQPVSILHAYPHSTFTTTEDPQSLLAVYYAHTEVPSKSLGLTLPP